MSTSLYDLFQSTKVEDLVLKGRPIVKAEYFEDVSYLLQKMADAKVHSAVIVDPDPKIGVVGFVDVLDLLVYLLDVTGQSSKDITKDSIENIKWEGQCFERNSSGSLINLSQKDPLHSISEKAPILDALQIFGKGVYRLVVVDEEASYTHRLTNVLSQSDIIQFIASKSIQMGSKFNKSLEEAGLHVLGVATVLDNVTALDALRYLRDLKVSGLGIVDSSGKLVGNLSATDMLGLTAENFRHLALPVRLFLQAMHGFRRNPVCCKSSDTVLTLINKLNDHSVQRIYIADDNMIPQGVITLTDVMQYLLIKITEADMERR